MTLSLTRLRLLVASLLSVSFLGALDHTVVSTSLATIAGDLGALEHLSQVVVGYTVASTVLLPVLGQLGDTAGPRRVFLTSLVAFLAASACCGLAPDMTWLTAARIVQGAASAGLQLMSQTIVAQVTTPRQRPGYLAVIGAAFPVAILVGPLLGGLITDHWGWRWVFWINVPVGLAALALAAVAVPHLAPAPRRRVDGAGALTSATALVALVLAVTWTAEPPAGHASTVAFAVAAVAFAAFLRVELRADSPVVPLRAFADRRFAAGAALSAVVGVGLFSVVSYLPTYFQMAYRVSATVSGLVAIATVFGMLVTSLLTGRAASRTGRYRVFAVLGTATSALGLLVMAFLPVGLPLGVPVVVMFAVGAGTGAFMNLVLAVVQSAVPRAEIGRATAAVNLVRQIGVSVTTAVIGGVVGFGVAALLPAGLDVSGLTPQVAAAAPAAVQAQIASAYVEVFSPVFLALAVTYALGLVAALLLPPGRLPDEQPSAADPIAV
ncbi:MFS transporter [Kineococcus sp. SYSU DK002]|uniref:MFS transporter n=1 Tax=Kineococcus sp. SYSU DK002 TaxID=3383123 RepID=UPI003D7D7685